MKNKKLWILLAFPSLVGLVIGGFFWTHRQSLTGAKLMELLPPESDIYFAADLPALGANAAVRKLLSDPSALPRDQDYERFLQATGFHYQTDLKEVALAKNGADWAGAARVRIDRTKMVQYLDSQGAQKSDALGKTVYVFGRQRPFRLAMLGQDGQETLVAFTVGGDETRIRQAVEREAGKLETSAAAELQRADLSRIAPGSASWMVARADRLLGTGSGETQVGGFGIGTAMLRGSQQFYLSVDSGPAQLNLRVEDYCDSATSAQRIAGAVLSTLALLKAMPADKAAMSKSATNPGALLAGVSVEQQQQSVLLRWRLDEEAMKLLGASQTAP